MSGISLDTTGAVDFGPHPDIELTGALTYRRYVSWDDLDAFTQGYIEALFVSACAGFKKAGPFMPYARQETAGVTRTKAIGFSDLAPETLAQIIAYCDYAQNAIQQGKVRPEGDDERARGAWAFRDYQKGFPPLTVTLGDDGKVYAAPAQGPSQ